MKLMGSREFQRRVQQSMARASPEERRRIGRALLGSRSEARGNQAPLSPLLVWSSRLAVLAMVAIALQFYEAPRGLLVQARPRWTVSLVFVCFPNQIARFYDLFSRSAGPSPRFIAWVIFLPNWILLLIRFWWICN